MILKRVVEVEWEKIGGTAREQVLSKQRASTRGKGRLDGMTWVTRIRTIC